LAVDPALVMADYDSRPGTYEHIHQVQKLLASILRNTARTLGY
jgi:hypothetical protein